MYLPLLYDNGISLSKILAPPSPFIQSGIVLIAFLANLIDLNKEPDAQAQTIS